jgi:hypothetical protein
MYPRYSKQKLQSGIRRLQPGSQQLQNLLLRQLEVTCRSPVLQGSLLFRRFLHPMPHVDLPMLEHCPSWTWQENVEGVLGAWAKRGMSKTHETRSVLSPFCAPKCSEGLTKCVNLLSHRHHHNSVSSLTLCFLFKVSVGFRLERNGDIVIVTKLCFLVFQPLRHKRFLTRSLRQRGNVLFDRHDSGIACSL